MMVRIRFLALIVALSCQACASTTSPGAASPSIPAAAMRPIPTAAAAAAFMEEAERELVGLSV